MCAVEEWMWHFWDIISCFKDPSGTHTVGSLSVRHSEPHLVVSFHADNCQLEFG